MTLTSPADLPTHLAVPSRAGRGWWLAPLLLLLLLGLAQAQTSTPLVLTVTPSSVSLRQLVTAEASGLDPRLTYTLGWGDGESDSVTESSTLKNIHNYRQSGTYSVTLSTPGVAPASATVTVTQPVPTLAATGSGLNATLNLGNLLVDYPYDINWGDDSSETSYPNDTAIQLTHLYRQPGTYVIRVTPQNAAPVTTTLTLAYPTPVLVLTPTRLTLRQAVTADISGLDPTLETTLNWGDATSDTLTGAASAKKAHTYAQPGTYAVTVTSSGTTPVTSPVTVTIPTPSASATASALNATLNLGNLLTDYPYSVAWGDGTTELLTPTTDTAQLTHTYTKPGTFTIQVTPKDAAPVTASLTLTVPPAVLSVVPVSAPVGQTVTASLSELTPTLTYTLDWGDGVTDTITGTATAQKTHAYSQPGTYTVTLTAPGTAPVTTVVSATVPTPTVTATGNGLGATLNLGNLLSGYVYSVAWGDGTSEPLTPTTATAQLKHTYAQPGTFTVQFTPQGGTPVTTPVTLSAPTPVLTATSSALSATLNLSNLLSDYPYSVAWGDGTTEPLTPTSDTAQLTHTYTKPGTFTVQVTPQGGTPVTTSVTLSAPAPVLTVTPSSTSIRQTVTANLTTLVPALTYTLDWGDQTTDTFTGAAAGQKTHTYTKPGTYVVTLTSPGTVPVTANVGATVPAPALTATSSALGATLNLSNLLTDYPYSVAWGDGTTEPLTPTTATAQLKHTYAQPGSFVIQVTPQGGTPVMTTLTLTAPNSALTVTPSSTSIRQTVTANLTTLIPALTYTLDWGDGVTDTITGAATAQKTHAYIQPGTYTVSLSASGTTPATVNVVVGVPAPVLTTTSSALSATLNLGNLLTDYPYTLGWGDGTTEPFNATSDAAQLKHTYTKPGTFTVQVTPQGGTPVTTSVTLNAPTPVLTATSSALSATLNLSNLLSGYSYSVAWGDGTTEPLTPTTDTAQLTHTYTKPDTFTIQVTPQGGTPVTTSVTLSAPTPVLTVTPSSTSIRQTVTANLTTLVPALTYTLDWGDGVTDTVTGTATAKKIHAYTQPGSYTVTLTAPGTTPVTAVVSTTLPTPTVTVTGNSLSATLNLGNLLTDYPYSVAWGDGTTEPFNATSDAAQLKHTYAQPGTFTVQVTPQGGTSVTTILTLTAPNSALTVTPSSTSIRQAVTANLTTLVPALTYTLDWGDQTTDTITGAATAQKTHAYTQPGTYTVSLSASGTTPATVNVVVGVPAPVLTTTSSALSAILNLSNLLSGYSYSVAWGDGTTEPLTPTTATAQLKHTYAKPGTFTVQVTPQGAAPVTTSVTLGLPTATLSVTAQRLDAVAELGQLVSGQLYTLDWGDTLTESFTATGAAARVPHTYAQPGSVTVTLSAAGLAPVSAVLRLSAPPALEVGASGLSANASFSQLIVNLTYTLDWGDGTTEPLAATAAETTRTHDYARPGTYAVRVSLPGGDSASASVTLAAPVATLTVTPATAAPGQPVTANLAGLAPSLTYTLTWGDGTSDTLTGAASATRTHPYAAAGTFTVTLGAPEVMTVTASVVVGVPVPTLSVTQDQLTATLTVGNLPLTSSEQLAYRIDWGDGSSETFVNSGGTLTVQRLHTYARPGTFRVQVTPPAGGAPVSTSVTLSVPDPVLTLTPTSVAVGTPVTANVSGLGPSLSYVLSWGDDTTETLTGQSSFQRTHTYAQAGNYRAQVESVFAFVTVTVQAPVVSATASDLNVTLNLSNLLPGYEYRIDWEYGVSDTLTATAATAQLNHAYARPGRAIIVVTPLGGDGVPTTLVLSASSPVLNVTPAALVIGETVTANLSNLLPSAGTYMLEWGDGSGESLERVSTASRTHTYASLGSFKVTLTSPITGVVTATVTVSAPTPTLSLNPVSGPARQPVTANAANLRPELTYTLDWGDGAADTLTGVTTAQRTHAYGAPGTYKVTLGAPQTTSVTASVTASVPAPTATVAGDNALSATLNLESLLNGYAYSVEWGDGTTETLNATVAAAQLSHTYTQPGTYTLKITTAGVSPVTLSVLVGAPSPVLTVTPQEVANVVEVQVGQTITASLTALVPALTYTLDWGDGITESITGVTTAQRTHVYLRTGNFGIRTDQAQGYSSRGYLVMVTLPAPAFTVSADRLDAIATLTELIPVVTYTFDWGDGTPAVSVTGVTTSSLSHHYAALGDYSLLLKASERVGVRQNLSIRVEGGALTLSVQGLQVTAQLSGMQPELSYTLNWGDNTSETLTGVATATRTHNYALPGTYTATLSAPLVPGAVATVTTVAQAPGLSVTAPTLTATAELSGLLPGVNYLFDWGDGAGEYLKDQASATLTHAYPQPGAYTVRIGQAPYGLRLPGIPEASAPLIVGLPPREAVQILGQDDLGAGYHFRVTGLLPEGEYRLDFGDGTTPERLTGGADRTVDHTYLRSGLYTVTLRFQTYSGDVVRATAVSQVQIALGIQLATLSFTQPYRDTDLKLNIAGPIEATLSLSYRGGGRLTGRWVLDGQPVENVDMTLPEATRRADADVKFTRTETRPGKHTLNFEFTGGVAPVFVRPVTYALNAPSTLTYGDFKVTVSTITELIASPGRSTTLSGTGTVKLIVGGMQLSDVNVTFTDQQTSESGKVLNGPTVTAELGGQTVRNVRLGDLGLRVDRLSLSSDGGTLSGSVTLPVPGGASANLAFTDTPLAADSGDLLATLRLSSPIQNLKLPEDGLGFSAAAAVLDLSGTKNVSELTGAYKGQATQSNDWMGLVFPAARLTVGTPILSQAVTLNLPLAYNLSGYVAALDLPATTSDVQGWRVDLSSLKASVLAGRISTTTGTGSVTLPLTAERMNVALGWNTNAGPGQRLTLSAPRNESVKSHFFGRTSLTLGEGVWTMNPDAASVTFSNARWFLDNAGNDVALNNLTMRGNGDVTLDGRPWSSVTDKTDLTVLGYPFAAAEVGVQRQSGGGYTLGLNGRLQVNENLPANTTNTKTLFWVNGGKDVKVTSERIHLSGTVAKVPFEINLDGALTDNGLLEFSGPGKLNLAGLVNVDAKARFGRFTGTSYEYFKPNTFGSVGYGSITVSARRDAQLSKPLFSAKRVEFYELLGGLTVNMDWPNGLDGEPTFRTAGPSMLFQAGALISGQQDPSAENPFKPYLKGILTVDSVGAFDMRADAWLVKKGESLNIGSPNGRALVSISVPIMSFVGSSGGGSTLDSSPDGRLLVQACVGSSSISSPGGLNCSGLTDLNVYDLMTLRGSMELYLPFSGADQHLYIGTKDNPIVVKIPNYPEGQGYLMVDRNSVRAGAGVTWGFEKGNSGSLLVCSWHWNIKATTSLNADFGITYSPAALDGAVKFSVAASASAGGCGVNVGVSANMTFDGKVHLASASKYFDGSVSAHVSMPVIPDIDFKVNTKVNF